MLTVHGRRALLGRDQHDVVEQKSGRVSALLEVRLRPGEEKFGPSQCASGKRSEKKDNVAWTIHVKAASWDAERVGRY